MGVLRIFLIVVEVLVCLMLVGVILLQKSRDSGLGMAFGAGMGENLFGAHAGNVMTRITVILAAVFLVNTTLLALVQPPPPEGLVEKMLPASPAPPPRTQQPPARDAAEAPPPDVIPFEFDEAPPDADAVMPEEDGLPAVDFSMETPAPETQPADGWDEDQTFDDDIDLP